MSERPLDISPYMLWYRRELPGGGVSISGTVNPESHQPSCRVYWGSHGCSRPKGHEGAHWCDCCECENHPDEDSGCVAGPPYYGAETHFYGDDCGGS